MDPGDPIIVVRAVRRRRRPLLWGRGTSGAALINVPGGRAAPPPRGDGLETTRVRSVGRGSDSPTYFYVRVLN